MRNIERVLARLPFAPVVAALFAIVAIVLVMATPQWLFERWVGLSGVAGIVPAATPPLGGTARFVAAVAAGFATGAVVWLLLTLGEKLLHRASRSEDVNNVEPDLAAGVRPLFAGNELGAPLMSDEAMAQALDELILESPIVDDVAEPNVPITISDGLSVAPDVEEPRTEEIPRFKISELAPAAVDGVVPPQMRVRSTDNVSISALMERLDAALARKPLGYRPDHGDVARLRRVIGR